MLYLTRVLIALGTIILPLSAQTAGKETIEQGRKEFEKACGFCHGADATGSRAPDLIRSSLVNRDHNGDLLGPLILNGRPEKGMASVRGCSANTPSRSASAKTSPSTTARIPPT